MPGTTAAGHSFSVVPRSALAVRIVVRHLGEQFAGAFDLGQVLSATVAAPALSVVSASLSATSLPSLRGASSSSGSVAPRSRGGWKLNSSKPAMPAARARNSSAGLDRRVAHRAAGHEVELHREIQRRRRDRDLLRARHARRPAGTRNSSTRKSPLSHRRCRRSSSFERQQHAVAASLAVAGCSISTLALRVPFQASGSSISSPLPRARRWRDRQRLCRRGSPAGGRLAAHEMLHRNGFAGAQQRAVEHRLGTQLGLGPLAHRCAKRQGSMPFCQLLNTKAMSSLARAVTKKPGIGRHSHLPRPAPAPPGDAVRIGLACPQAPAAAVVHGHPAPATGAPRSSEVTHTSAFSRPIFTCTPRLVASTAVRTNIGALSSSASPRRRDSISTT